MPVDLVPHNVVLTEDDEMVAIDQEWSVRGYDRESVLLRGLFHSAVQLASMTRPERLLPCGTVSELVTAMAAEIDLDVDDERVDRFCAHESGFQSVVNTTDATRSMRQTRSSDDLREVFGLSLGAVRGGDRFDVQWQRARNDIDELYRSMEQQREERAALEHALASARQEAAELRARQPVALARRVARGVLTRTGLLDRR